MDVLSRVIIYVVFIVMRMRINFEQVAMHGQLACDITIAYMTKGSCHDLLWQCIDSGGIPLDSVRGYI